MYICAPFLTQEKKIGENLENTRLIKEQHYLTAAKEIFIMNQKIKHLVFIIVALITSLLTINATKAQETFVSDWFIANNEGYNYKVKVILTLNRFEVKSINWDPGYDASGSSFGYNPLFDYQVIVEDNGTAPNVTNPDATFWNFDITLTSSTQGQAATNSLNSQTYVKSGSYTINDLSNNNEYQGSATALGNTLIGAPLTANTIYSGENAYTLLNYFQYNQLTIKLDWSGMGGIQTQTLTPSTNTPLPVKFGNINAQYDANNHQTLINWETVSEKNNDYFIVEHSLDGKNFTELTKVQGIGTSTDIVKYSAIDHQYISGTVYYRIKQVDIDGAYEYSKIININISNTNDKTNTLSFYPNPAKAGQILHLKISSSTAKNVHISILNINGIDEYSNTTNIYGGDNNIDIILPNNINAGLYFIKVTDANGLKLSENKLLLL